MGKRQIGQLDVSDLITTLLISEIASLSITDPDIPISHSLVPIIILLTFEVVTSAIIFRFPTAKKLISASPTTLIKNGKLCFDQMKKARVSADELISELRQNNILDIDEVSYAILEQNGKISVIQKEECKPPSAKDLKMQTRSQGIYHIVVENSAVIQHGLTQCEISKKDVYNILKKKRVDIRDVYLLLISDSGEIKLILKEQAKK
jgi:uncharacterized membrane protein YcaP (DUF421 family)